MDIATAVVLIFGMLFLILSAAIISHYRLERKRIEARVDYESSVMKGLKWDPPALQPPLAPGTAIIHVADHYAIGNDFRITSGPEKKLWKRGLVLDKPSRDTILVKWTYSEPPAEVQP